MMRSLFSGVSGLKNHQTRMDVIGNNISNVNTTGFKSSRVTFSDMLSQNLTGASAPQENRGGTNPKQIGLGSSVAAVDLLFTNGSVQSTGKNTDLCLSGNGLFVVSADAKGTNKYYTRNGAFEFDAAGNYVNPGNGYYVLGWTADENGKINTNDSVSKIVVEAGKQMKPKITDQVKYTGNLNAGEPSITSITAVDNDGNVSYPPAVTLNGYYKSVTLSLSDGTTQIVSGTSGIKYTQNHSMPIVTSYTAYDSEGNDHTITILMERSEDNKWQASIRATDSDPGIPEDDGSRTKVDMAITTIPFNEDGSYDDTTGAAGSMKLTYTSPNGAKDQSLTIDFSALTQYSGGNTSKATANGYGYGVLQEVAVDLSGVITGTYTNGQRRAEGQVAIAQFNNASGLTKTGDSLYQESNNSGVANIRTANDLGVKITPSALEMSNVDVANEFTDMIITQRGFQSNSKIITTSDEMLETLINLKR